MNFTSWWRKFSAEHFYCSTTTDEHLGAPGQLLNQLLTLWWYYFINSCFQGQELTFLFLTSALPFVTKATASRINLGQLNILFNIILISECTRQQRQTRGISFAKLPISILSVLITKYNIRSLIRFLWIPHCCYVTELRDESERMHAVCKGTWRTYTLCVLLLFREGIHVCDNDMDICVCRIGLLRASLKYEVISATRYSEHAPPMTSNYSGVSGED